VAGLPLQVTRPASIHLSASRLEQTPVSLMYLLSLNEPSQTRLRKNALTCFASACEPAPNGSGP
jgi:hypothetical protein